MGVVEMHPWNATVDDIERADRLVFDLVSRRGVGWPFVIDTALELRRVLEQEGFRTWHKLTGGKGLHIVVPLNENNQPRGGASLQPHDRRAHRCGRPQPLHRLSVDGAAS